MRRRGFFSALLVGAVAPIAVAAKSVEPERQVRFVSDWERVIMHAPARNDIITCAFVRVGALLESESLSPAELEHWNRHIFLCKDFDDLTAQVASASNVAWPPAPALIPQYHFTGDWPNFQVWPLPDGRYTITVNGTTEPYTLPLTSRR